MENKIQQKLDIIAECILVKIQKQHIESDLGLYNGGFGILLFLHYYSRYSKKNVHVPIIDQYTNTLLNLLGSDIHLHTFCGGLSGILYLFEFLRENRLDHIDIASEEEVINEYLVRLMRRDIQNEYYDFMHGALGVGLYFLKKKTNEENIQELIDFLYNTAEKDVVNKIFKWNSVIDEDVDLKGFNISMSHGMSSIVIFLSRAIKNNIKNQRLYELLEGSINYILSQELNIQEYGSFFPHYSKENFPLKSRLAWCYGDLGIAMALWIAGKTINNQIWMDKSLNIFLQTTTRIGGTDTNVVDAGICHGSVGIAMIYRRMYIETNLNEFIGAANYWIDQTLDHSQFNDGLAGYKTYVLNNWINDYSLLTGISGIGLSFISYLSDDLQCWDEILLLS